MSIEVNNATKINKQKSVGTDSNSRRPVREQRLIHYAEWTEFFTKSF